MPLVLDVLLNIDERAAQAQAQQLHRQFEEGGHEHGEKYGESFLEGVMTGFHRGEFESLSGIFESTSLIGKASTSGEAVGLAFAGGVVAAGSAALVDLGVKVGESFERINREITLHSGASGQALEDLKGRADALVGSMDSSTKSLGSDFAILNGRLQLTGDQLDQMTRHVEMLRDRFGDFNVGALAGAFRNLGVSGKDADDVLASVVATTQRSGAPLADMVNNLAAFSPTFRDLHLNAQQSAAVLGELERSSIPASRGMTAIEQAMKAFTTKAGPGEDFAAFMQRAARSIDDLGRVNPAAAQQLSGDILGTRKWEEGAAALHDVLNVMRQAPGTFNSNGQALTDLGEKTRTLGGMWQEVKNKIDVALQPTGTHVVDEVGEKMTELLTFIDAHAEDLRHLFESGIGAVEAVVGGVAHLGALLGAHPQLVRDVAIAFGTWESIKGVASVVTTVQTLTGLFGGLPAAAAEAAAGVEIAEAEMAAATTAAGGEMELAFGPVMTTLGTTIPAEAETAATAITTSMTAADGAVLAFNGTLTTVLGSLTAIGTALAAVLVAKQAIDTMNPGVNEAAPPKGQRSLWDTVLSWMSNGEYDKHHPAPGTSSAHPGGPAAPPRPGTGRFAPGPSAPDAGGRAAPTLPDATAAATPDGDNGGPPGGLPDLTPQDFLPTHKGPRLPTAPEVPFDPAYGAAPRPGETGQQYDAEQRVLEQRHAVAEARARLNQLEGDSNATQDDIVKARNDVLKAQQGANSAELAMYRAENEQLSKHSHEMEHLGAEIDKDFGISKGLVGIVENITKFVGNLALAGPMMGMQQQIDASGIKQTGGSGLIGMAATSGAFGPQFMPNAAAGAGVPEGPFGGTPGFGANRYGSAFGDASYSKPALPSISSPEDVATAGAGVASLYRFAESMQGTPYSMALRDDCSGMVSRLASAALGMGDLPAGQRFSTANEGQWLSSHGFLSGMGGPDDLNIGWHIGGPAGGHTAATLPGGVNAEQGGANPAFTLGPGAAGASNPEFEYHAHLPMSAGAGPLQGPGAVPGPPMYTDARGAVIGAPSAYHLSIGGSVPTSGGAPRKPGQPGPESSLPYQQDDKDAANMYAPGWNFEKFWRMGPGGGWGDAPNGLTRDDKMPTVGPGGMDRGSTQIQWPWGNGGNTREGIDGGHDTLYDPSARILEAGFSGAARGTDTIPAMLTPREFVQPVDTVDFYGNDVMEGLRQKRIDPTSIRYLAGGGGADDQPQGATRIGGQNPDKGYGSGTGGGGGGGGMGGMMAGGPAAAAMSFGASIAMQEAQRGIQYAASLGGVAAEAGIETFLPTGASQLAQNSWLTKIAGGLMGAQPQLPNMAGKSQNASPEGKPGLLGGVLPMPGDPAAPTPASVAPTPASVAPTPNQVAAPRGETVQAAPAGDANAGGSVHYGDIVHVTNNIQTQDKPDAIGHSVGLHTRASHAPSGMR